MGYTQQYRGTKYSVNLVSKLRIETVVKDEVVDQMIKEITTKLSSGNPTIS